MGNEPRPIAFAEFARHLPAIFDALAQSQNPVFVERAGQLFRVEAEPRSRPGDIWAGYDPERVRQGLRRSAGAFAAIDRDQLLADLREQREQDSIGRPA